MITPIPLISVTDVPASSRFYQQVLGAASGHGGDEYEQVIVDGELVLQLHALTVGHHHGPLGDPSVPLGNGLALWFTTEAFDDAVARVRDSGAEIVTDVHVNPNSGCREIWLHDPDGYLVVIAQPFAPSGQRRSD
ncbi:MAG TPA: VOC family protein [Solirubrobacteraceae bacterium]|nr:VOC family protein [Solirubrobacteraceae bacterium]